MNSTKVECMIFDFGGVIGFPQQADCVKNMVRLSRMNEDEFIGRYFDYRLEYDQGLIDKKEYWKRVVNSESELDDRLVDGLVREDYHSWTKINDRMTEYIKALKNKVKRIVLLSNVNIEARNYIRDDLKIFRYFDEVFCSCDLKLMKPDKAIYQHVINELGLDPGKCLFIDDIKVNIDGAKEVGLNGICFKSYDHFVDKLEKLYDFVK